MFARPRCVVSLGLLLAECAVGQSVNLNDPTIESQYLAVEITGQLRPSSSLANQIKSDLAAIRAAYPQYADIRVLPSWMPGETLVGMTNDAYAQFTAGTFHGFDSIFADLGVPAAYPSNFGKYVRFAFGQVYHGERLSDLFDPVNGVRYAEPNGIFGDGNDIVARSNRTYTLSRGYGDCPAGCIYRQTWDFTVTDQGVFQGLLAAGSNGDFNNDGSVDGADYVALRLGSASSLDAAKYADWRRNFGTTSAGSTSSPSGPAVPEPASVVLVTLVLALAVGRWNRGVRPGAVSAS
jgi:hypothetical protein